MATFVTRSVAPVAAELIFDFITDLSTWPLFRGHGPIPAIVRAELPEGGRVGLGTRVRVTNSDGTVHHERVTVFDPPRRYAIRMELKPPVSALLETIEETVELEALQGGRTQVSRTFEMVPRSLLAALPVRLLARFLRRAVEDHDRAVGAALEERYAGERG